MISQSNINLATIIFISFGLIFLGGAFFYTHNNQPIKIRNPIYWSLGIGLASAGSTLLVNLILKNTLPKDLLFEINAIKRKKI